MPKYKNIGKYIPIIFPRTSKSYLTKGAFGSLYGYETSVQVFERPKKHGKK